MARPTDFSNLYAWYKADALALSDGAAVASWADSSGAVNPMAQATGANQPTYKTNILNGKPAVLFNGGLPTWLSATGPTNDTFTMIVVAATTDLINDQTWFQNGNGNGAGISFRGATAKRDFVYRLVADHEDGTPVSGKFDIMTGTRVTGVNGQGIYYVGGAQQLTTTDTIGTPSAQLIMGSLDTTAAYLNGYVAEAMIFTRVLTDRERAEIHTYLADKYGLPAADYLSYITPMHPANRFVGPMALRQTPQVRWAFTEQNGNTPSSAVAYTNPLADASTATDSISKAITKNLADTSTATDSLGKTVTVPLADSSTATDSITKSFTKNLSDASTATDSITKAIVKNIADSSTATDAIAKTTTVPLADTSTATDAISKAYTKRLSDTSTASDAILKMFVKNLADTATATDAISKMITKFLADASTASDIITPTKSTGVHYDASFADTSTATDAIAKQIVKALADTSTASDVISKQLTVRLADMSVGVDHISFPGLVGVVVYPRIIIMLGGQVILQIDGNTYLPL